MSTIVKAIIGVVEIVVGIIFEQPWLVALGVASLLEVAASLLAPKPGANGLHTQIAYDPTYPRQAIFGRTKTAGSLIFQGTWGDTNQNLEYVVALADHECDGFEQLYVDGELVALGTLDALLGYPVTTSTDPITGLTGTNYTGKLWFKFFSGAAGQVADAHLTAKLGSAVWPSTSVGQNICYFRVTATFDQKIMPNVPRFEVVLRGAKLYDPTQDTTAGGSGAHRWGTPSTYQWSENPAVIAYNISRGFYVGSELLCGASAIASELPYSGWASAINSCNDAISLKAGGTELRYRIGGQFGVDRDATQFLSALAASTGGRIGTGGGTILYLPGVTQSSIYSFTDDAIMAEEDYEYSSKLPFQALKNSIHGTFVDPNQNWSLASLPTRTSSSDQTEDGGIPLGDGYQFDMVHSHTQAQRVMEIMRRKNRRQARHQIVLSPGAYLVERGDWVDWTSSQFGYAAKNFLVASISYQANLNVIMALEEIDSTVYSWNPATDELPLGAGSLSSADPAPLPGAVQNFAVQQVSNAVVFSWTDLVDHNVKGYDIRYGPQGASVINSILLTEASRTTEMTNAGVPPGNWTFYIAGHDLAGNTGTWVSKDLTVTNFNTVVDQIDAAPDWIGTLSGCIAHWTGVLVPLGTFTCDHYTAWEDFEPITPDVVASASFTGPQIDLGFNSSVRVYSSPVGAMVYGAAGSPDIQFNLDTWPDGGTDPATFTPWTSTGYITERYFVPQIVIDTANQYVVTDFTVTIDALQKTQSALIPVGAGPTAINFSDYGLGPFHLPPFATPTPADATLTSASSSGTTKTGTTLAGYLGSSAHAGTVNLLVNGV